MKHARLVALVAAAALEANAPTSAQLRGLRATTTRVQVQVYEALAKIENCTKWRNPGCLKYARQIGASVGRNRYAVFDTIEHGRLALWLRVQAGEGKTVLEFLSGYNPGVENYPWRVAVVAGLDLEETM